MSIAAIQSVWNNSQQNGTHLLLMLAIADNADEDTFSAWPSTKTLGAKIRLSTRRAQELLQQLANGVEHGEVKTEAEIKIEPGSGPYGSDLYTILLPGARNPSARSRASLDDQPSAKREISQPKREISQDKRENSRYEARDLAEVKSPEPQNAASVEAPKTTQQTSLETSVKQAAAATSASVHTTPQSKHAAAAAALLQSQSRDALSPDERQLITLIVSGVIGQGVTTNDKIIEAAYLSKGRELVGKGVDIVAVAIQCAGDFVDQKKTYAFGSSLIGYWRREVRIQDEANSAHSLPAVTNKSSAPAAIIDGAPPAPTSVHDAISQTEKMARWHAGKQTPPTQTSTAV